LEYGAPRKEKFIMKIPPILNRFYNVKCNISAPDVKRCAPNPETTAVQGKYLPRGREVFAGSDTVLSLGNSWKDLAEGNEFLFGLDNDYIEDIFKFKGDNAVISVGRCGDLKLPEGFVSDEAPVLLEIRKAPDKEGYFVRDTSLNGTKVSEYLDYTNKKDGFPVPKQREVLIKKDAKLNLGGDTEVDLSSPEIKKQLEKLRPEEQSYIGRGGYIEVPDCGSRVAYSHLSIKDVGDYYAVRDNSPFGTTIINHKYRDKWSKRVNKERPLAQWQIDLMNNPFPRDDREWYLQKPPTLED